MAERKSIRLQNDHLDAMQDMVDQNKADNRSEAHRMFLQAGMYEYGYRNGEFKDTPLRLFIQQLSYFFIVGGIVWTGVTFYYPRVFALPAVGLFLSGLTLAGIDSVLESHEPKVTNGLKGMFGEKA